MSLKYAVLGLLMESPHSGYEIKQEIERMMGDLWPISYGQLYPTLKKLADESWVTWKTLQGKKAKDKNVYSITPEGVQNFRRWLGKEKKRIHHSIKDEFTLSFFFLDMMEREKAEKLLLKKYEETKEYYEKCMSEHKKCGNGTPFYRRVLTKKMLLHVEAEKQWLEEVIREYSTS
ncbi:MAG: helix-turn-helix transcriptional regulator [Spirochaetaceae bacterium]